MKKTLIAMMAALIALGGAAVMARAGNHRDARALQLDQVPPAVQKVIKQEAAGRPLKSITMGDDDETGVYEAKFADNAQQVELKIAADGQVLSREVERGHREDQEENDD